MAITVVAWSLTAMSAAAANVSPQDQIIALEKAWSDAVVNHQPEKVREILDESFVGIDGRGAVSTRDDEIAEASPVADANASKLVGEALSDIRVRLYGDTGVLTAVNTATFEKGGVRSNIRYRRTTIYVRAGGTWRCVGFHGSRLL